MKTITINKSDWQTLPKTAQQEIYDFYLFIKQKYKSQDELETLAFSNHSANLIEDWQDEEEDKIWK